MFMGRASTFPAGEHQPRTPCASSEHEAKSEPRTSISDEAQACFNLILILRNDTQHLISLRNDSLQAFDEIDTARPLLSQINAAITNATRSVYELGPFLERYRWPPCELPRASIMRLKVLRKRSRSLSFPVPAAGASADPGLSPDELFSWTLALTAQHAAVLASLEQLESFLVYGAACISEDDRRRHDATKSWWQQRHSEFENVTLIQSILQRPKSGLKGMAVSSASTPAMATAEAAQPGAVATPSTPTATTIPSIFEHDDSRSETLTFCGKSVRSWPGDIMTGLTARPRTRIERSPQAHSHLTNESWGLRNMYNRPLAGVWTDQGSGPAFHPGPVQEEIIQQEPRVAEEPMPRSQALAELPLSRFNSSVLRPRITTAPLPPLVGLQALLPEKPQRARSATVDPSNVGHAVSPLPSTPELSRHSSRVSHISPVQASPNIDTTYTPLNQQVSTVFAHTILPSKTKPPVIHKFDNMNASPVYLMQPVLELDVSAVENGHYTRSSATQEDDRHWPYLAYMARKQAVATSRWSVRRSKSTKSKTTSNG